MQGNFNLAPKSLIKRDKKEGLEELLLKMVRDKNFFSCQETQNEQRQTHIHTHTSVILFPGGNRELLICLNHKSTYAFMQLRCVHAIVFEFFFSFQFISKKSGTPKFQEVSICIWLLRWVGLFLLIFTSSFMECINIFHFELN